ncbi:Hypothetical predicted protein [Mytilus galloprovincialis]|uniref:Uncharacterized protein n=1 Tax=Mytilus galloprovincialis TaxID=29158 RepID=A0A8B6C0M7_MYTGA|nr:Hypothetical predicted protein [Mytilus galloprovincialis]
MAEESEPQPKKIKVTAVGDSGVGKTCLLMTYATNTFPEGDVPELYEHMTIRAGNNTVGLDEYRRMRELFTVGTNVFMVCFSVTDPLSLENVKKNWLTEIRILSPKASFILVGTKTDLREDQSIMDELQSKNEKAISIQDGIKTAKAVGAKTYVECSAVNSIGLKEVFETVVKVATDKLNPKTTNGSKKPSSPCVIS